MLRKLSYFKINVRLTKRGFIVLFIPYLTMSTWYFLFSAQILDHTLRSLGATTQVNWVKVCFNFSIVLSIMIGSVFVDKVNQLRIIYIWAVIMPLATISLLLASNPFYIWAVLFLLGALFGMGSLAYCVYFCSLTNIEERGRVGGIIVFISLLFSPVFLLLSYNFFGVLIAFVSLGVGTLVVRLWKPKEKAGLTTKEGSSTVQSYRKRAFLLYITPWLILCFINGTLAGVVTTYLTRQFPEALFLTQVLRYLGASFGALIGGVLADWAGRKVALIVGLGLYGIGTPLSGLASTPSTCILSAFIGSLSWGLFLVVYLLVVWGDLTSAGRRAHFYAAGYTPFYLSMGWGYLVLPKILYMPVVYVTLMSSFLIFLSTFPILFAKELLPTYMTEKMYLSLHIQWIKKFLKKHKSSESKG